MADKYKIKLLYKNEIAVNTMGFYFTKPEGFIFKAGQSMDITLINPTLADSKGNTRTFTISCTPSESELMISTRIRDSAFKKNLMLISPGTELDMEGPFGSFILPNNSKNDVVFLTGGIGVTPAISIIKDASHKKLPHKINLFYANKTPEDAVFMDEFHKIEGQNPNFTFIPTMTRVMDKQFHWNGEQGHINKQMLEKYLGSVIINKVYFLSGPMKMVSALSQVLTDLGIDTDYIRTEEFPGY